jgi:hypothetical protein
MSLSREDILFAIKDAVHEVFQSDPEEMDDDFDFSDDYLPRTTSFKARDIDEMSEKINVWVEETKAYIISITVNILRTNEGDSSEALVVYEPAPERETPDWLRGLSD